MECTTCGAPLADRSQGWDVEEGKILCTPCFQELGSRMFASSQSAVAGERTKLLRKWAKEEYADVVPRDVLRDAVENGVRKILTGGDPETAYGETVARIQLMTATMVERVRIEVVRGLRVAIEEGLAQLENEARENLRKLHDLGGVR